MLDAPWQIMAAIGLLSLAACGPEISDLRLRCPASLRAYSEALQLEAADELAGLPPDAALGQMISDYGQLRAELRGAGCLLR